MVVVVAEVVATRGGHGSLSDGWTGGKGQLIILIKYIVIIEPLVLVIDLPVEGASMREDILLLRLLLLRTVRQLSV